MYHIFFMPCFNEVLILEKFLIKKDTQCVFFNEHIYYNIVTFSACCPLAPLTISKFSL